MIRRAVAAGALLALFIGFWFATGGIPDRAPASWLTAQAIAHRGEWTTDGSCPENSLAAFDRAARHGFAIELDVQITADGRVVVFHDDDLSRMTGLWGSLKDATLGDLREARLLGGDEIIPTLAEALSLVGGRVPVFVEVKNRGAVGELEDQVARELSAYRGKAAVLSFNPYSLARIAKKAPDVFRGQLSSAFHGEHLKFYEVFLLSNLMMNWTSHPDFIAYDIAELPTVGTTIQRWRGRPLIGWAAVTAEERVDAAATCDAVMCDPAALP